MEPDAGERLMLRALLDLVYPRRCVGCGQEPGPSRGHLCWDCLSQVPFVGPPFCARCGDPVEGRVDASFVCYHCSRNEPWFDQARSAARYRGVVQTVLRSFKYGQGLWLRSELVRVLAACLAVHYDAGGIDAVCAVPLYPARRRERGYNQSELLAVSLARRLRKPVVSACLARIRPTRTQTNLTAKERASNVKGAFRTRRRHRLDGRRILLIDDVMTTGATVNECARVLNECGAGRVQVLTVARG